MTNNLEKFSCQYCKSKEYVTLCNLGMQPPSNNYRNADDLSKVEPFMPLKAVVCRNCLLAQLDYFEDATILFSEDYAYFSSFSTSWLEHAKTYASTMVERFGIGQDSLVVEIASNDGYLLQYFKQQNIQVLGIEPSKSVALAAIDEKGIPTEIEFFGKSTAEKLVRRYGKADLMAANNVLAHVPDIRDFLSGFPIFLKNDGVITFEFPHLLRMLTENQFDTIYHEHFSYLSLTVVSSMLDDLKMRVFNIEELSTHGGSLRVYVCHSNSKHNKEDSVDEMINKEAQAGLTDPKTYSGFQSRVDQTKRSFLKFLIDAKESGKCVVGYGAPAKGNTLLNYSGVRSDLLDYVVDRSPAKQGRFLPGTHIPIYYPDKIFETQPDFVVIMPWNLKEEIAEQLSDIRTWDGQFVTVIPQLCVF